MFIKIKASTKEAGRLKQTLALAVSQLEGGESLDEVVVLPQQLLKQLLVGVQHALQKLKETVSYAGFSRQVSR
jgi:hypothetical protein